METTSVITKPLLTLTNAWSHYNAWTGGDLDAANLRTFIGVVIISAFGIAVLAGVLIEKLFAQTPKQQPDIDVYVDQMLEGNGARVRRERAAKAAAAAGR
jgi:hypothetical protein